MTSREGGRDQGGLNPRRVYESALRDPLKDVLGQSEVGEGLRSVEGLLSGGLRVGLVFGVRVGHGRIRLVAQEKALGGDREIAKMI